MIIPVEHVDETIICRFIPYAGGRRLWMRNDSLWYPSIAWCPHLNTGGGECTDCSLVLDGDDE